MFRLLVSFLLLLSACSHSPGKPDAQRYDQIVVVGTNDFHGFLRTIESDYGGEKVLIGGAEWFAGYIRILERKFGDHLVLLDGGDVFQGTMESNLFLGQSTIRYYNLLPYRAIAVGNHEFDYGPRRKGDPDPLGALKDRIADSRAPFVQANIHWKKNGSLWREKNLLPHVIFRAGDYRVGVIGLTTTTTPGKTLPQYVENLDFRQLIEPTRREAEALRKRGADLVLIAMHEGGENPGDPLYELLGALPKGTIDAVVAGHNHTEVHEFVHDVPVIQSRSRGLFFGRIDLFVDRATRRVEPSLTKIHNITMICGTWFRTEDHCDQKWAKDRVADGRKKDSDFLPLRKPVYEGVEVKPDARVLEVLRPFYAKVDQKKKEVLGTAQRDFDWSLERESEMGFFFVKAFRWKFPYAKIVYINGGGVRRRFFKGPITYGDLFEVHPFENYALAVKMTGKQFKDLVRVGVSGTVAIPILWGAKVTYKNTKDESTLRDVNGDGRKSEWERDRLVTLTWDNGAPIRDEETFWVATSDYLASGGDNTAHVFDPIPARDRRYTSLSQRDLAAEYLRNHKGLSLPTKDEMRIRAIP